MLGYLSQKVYEDLILKVTEVTKMLFGLYNSIK